MAKWCWFAVVDEPPPGAWAHATINRAGGLAVWPAGPRPVSNAMQLDASIVDPAGESGWLSLVVVPKAVAPLFDDPAVCGAIRRVLAGLAADAVSTLTWDAVHFGGAVTVRRGDDAVRRLRDDPFARLYPARVLRVPAGLFGRALPPAGPGIQRYAGQPWPLRGFAAR